MISFNFDTNQQYTFVVVSIFFNNAMKYMKWSGSTYVFLNNYQQVVLEKVRREHAKPSIVKQKVILSFQR